MEKSVEIKSSAVQNIFLTIVEPIKVITVWRGNPVYSLAGQRGAGR